MNEINGCTDPDACNYNSTATIDDGTCEYYLDACGICGGGNHCDGPMIDNNNDSFNEACSSNNYIGPDFDCNGICFGESEYDECGICGGQGISDGQCDCYGNIEDCLGECGGNAVIDCNGICAGNTVIDCSGICGGNAVIDCNGECGGNEIEDECGVCGGQGIPDGACDCNGNYLDCNNECSCLVNDQSHPSCNIILDDCNICGGNNFYGSNLEIMDGENAGQCSCNGADGLVSTLPEFFGCDGECSFSPSVIDDCGICGGPGSIYECGCDNISIGACDCDDNIFDECGVCGGDGINIGECDCNGEIIDACFNCTTSPCNIIPEIPIGLNNNYLTSNIKVPLLLTGYENLQAIDMDLVYDNMILEFQGVTFENTPDNIIKEEFLTIITNTDIYNSSSSISIFQNASESNDGTVIAFNDNSENDIFLYFVFNFVFIDESINNLASYIGFNQFKVNNFDFIDNFDEGSININVVACLDVSADNPNFEAIDAVNISNSLLINGLCEYTVIAEVNEWGMVADSIVISSEEDELELDISLGTQLLIDGEPISGEIEISVSGEQPSEEIIEILPDGLEVAGEITAMEPLGLAMDPPAGLDIGYDSNTRNFENSSYSIYSLSSPESDQWEEIQSICENNICSAEISTFALYAVLEIIRGCMDINAFNYNNEAVEDDGSCIYAGCMDIDALNYFSDAAIDDGSCIYEGVLGCTDSSADNYDPSATIDDGSCLLHITTATEYELLSIYPNPFNSILNIKVESENYKQIKILAHNIYGELIDIIYSGHIAPGSKVIYWDAKYYPSGIYLISYNSDSLVKIKKVIYLK